MPASIRVISKPPGKQGRGFSFWPFRTVSEPGLPLQALALEVGERERAEAHEAEPSARSDTEHPVFYEITIASVDQPKLLSRLSEALVSPHAVGCLHARARNLQFNVWRYTCRGTWG